MKYSRYEQVRIISADSYAEMEQKFNETMIELSHYHPHREILAPMHGRSFSRKRCMSLKPSRSATNWITPRSSARNASTMS